MFEFVGSIRGDSLDSSEKCDGTETRTSRKSELTEGEGRRERKGVKKKEKFLRHIGGEENIFYLGKG